jgi:GNAT superfamily N-acetyltransferase
LAEDPGAHGPVPRGFERIEGEGYCMLFGPMEQLTMAQRLRLGEEDVEVALAQVRELARARDRNVVTWWIGRSTTPGDLEQRLLALGLEPAKMPVHEPLYGALALVQPLSGSSDGFHARRVESFEEFLSAWEISWAAFGHDEEQRRSTRESLPLLYDLQQKDVSATYLAFVDDSPVAAATAVFAEHAVMLVGGATLPEARGRGCYRALVQARWEDAVRRGTPALVVQAGAMSRPILERLGFQLVSELRVLVDELG